MSTNQFERIDRPGGRIAVEVTGDGPLVVLLPGMGELRSSYRFTVPALVAAGFRAAAMDLRGHGDSDATFTRYDDVAAAQDALAVIDHFGGPAVLVGNSMGAGAAVWAAAERPDAVRGIVLLGPFVRDVPVNPLLRLLTRVAMAGPWAPRAWAGYLPKLYPGRRPADFDEHMALIRGSMRDRAHARAFARTTRTTHAPAAARLAQVTVPALVVMGERDADFADPAGEARFVADSLHGELLMVPGAGHYPQVEDPEVVNPAVIDFLRRVSTGA